MNTSKENLALSANYFKSIAKTYDEPAKVNELFEAVPEPSKRPSRVSSALTNIIHNELSADFDDSNSDMRLRQLLERGLEATREVVHVSFNNFRGEITHDEAAQAVHSPTTIYTLAALSLRHEDFEALTFNLPDKYFLTPDKKAITLRTSFQASKEGGCPFAGKEGVVKYGAAFFQFAKFSADLALLSHMNHFDKIK